MRTRANLGRTRLTRADEGRQLKTRASHIDDQGDGTKRVLREYAEVYVCVCVFGADGFVHHVCRR